MRLFIGLLLLLFTQAKAQDFATLDSTMKKYAQYYQPEKIHLHFDRAIVNPKETLHFKAYLLQGNLPSVLSATLYVDFFADSGKLIAHTTWPILESTAKGSIDLPEGYTGQQISIVAYTAWMKNFDSSFLYQHRMPVVQPVLIDKKQLTKPVISIRFLPEGGNLIEGTPNNIAFSATDQFGLPIAVKGCVLNMAGDTVTTFSTTHHGRGKLSIWAEPGQTYTAFWTDVYGEKHTTSLPTAVKLPVSIQVSTTEKGIRYMLQSSADVAKQKVYVLAYIHHQLVFRAGYVITPQALKIGEIETAAFPSGLLQLTVFNEQWQPIAERVAFVHGLDQEMQVDIATDKKTFQPRAKNGFTVFVPDTLRGSLSIAVTDEFTSEDIGYGIMSQLLLKSDLRGYIHEADWYFRGNYLEKQKELDLVMLTNGWRRYPWEDIVAGRLPKIDIASETAYIQLEGKVSGFTQGAIRVGEQINLFMQGKDSTKQFFSLPLDHDGSFGMSNMLFTDTTTIYYSFNKNKQLENTIVQIQNGFQPASQFKHQSQQKSVIDSSWSLFLQQRLQQQKIADSLSKTNTLQEVVVQAKMKTRKDEINDAYVQNGMFNSPGSEQIFDVMSDARSAGTPNIFNYLKGMVAGLVIREDMLNGAQVTWRGDNTELYLNEIRVDARTLQTVPMSDIAVVKTFRPPFMGAYMGGSGGAIAVYTKKGNKAESATVNNSTKGLARVKLAGYSVYKEYVSPDYASSSNFSKKDFRTTLFWDPMVLTDRFNRQIPIHFYHNDIGKKYRIIIEGMNEAGKLVHVEKLVE